MEAVTNIFDRLLSRESVKFIVVGTCSNLVGYGLFLLVTYKGIEPKTAMSTLYVVAVTTSFLFNRKWTFRHDGNWVRSGIQYFLAQVSGYLINLLLLYVFVDLYAFPHQAIQALAMVVVASYLFTVFKLLVFTHKRSGGGGR